MLPVLTLVGRPNVGKSTLFNRLTRSRDALVADQPGLTRDRQYGVGRIGPRPYVVVDTGGLTDEPDGVAALMARQVRRAIEEADHLLFLVDARDGCTAGDETIVQGLRQTGKPLTLVANKIDHLDEALVLADFHRLGIGDPIPIAASLGRGVQALMERALAALPGAEPAAEEDEHRPSGIEIAVIGRPNVGKSTLINRLLGEERMVVCDEPGTTRDSVAIPFQRDGHDYVLIDTAGVRRRSRVSDLVEKFSVIKTLQSIEEAQVVILVLDARAGVSEQDATLAGHVLESGRALVMAVNKWDGLDPTQRERVREEIGRKLGFLDFASYHFISALQGSGVSQLLGSVKAAYRSATRDLPTPELNRILAAAVQEHQPPLVRGRRIKLRYAHQGGRNPPIIVIHGNQTEELPAAFQRYLINRFRRDLRLHGTPLRLELRSGENPYAGKRNPPTLSQERQRKRLLRFVKRKS